MERVDAAMFKNAVDGSRNGFLEFEGSFGIEIGLCGEIKVHILDIEMGDERFAIRERAANVQALLETVEKFIRHARLAHWPFHTIRRDVVAGCSGWSFAAEKFQNPRAHSGAFVESAQGLTDVLHGGGV
jgi:hypothetical protein